MIERYVFVKLKPEHAGEDVRSEIRSRAAALASIPEVRGVAVGAPADAGARSAWDLSLLVRFEALDAVDRYLDHPDHRAFYEGFLRPRLEVIKAWNFEV